MLRRRLRRDHRVAKLEVRGLDHLERAIAAGQGVMITANHPSYADPLVLLGAAGRLGTPFHYLTAWEMFADAAPLDRWLMERHGCFSIDRDRNDLAAFRLAVDVLATDPHPLVVFAEGHVYQRGECPVPLRDGAAAMARAAARRSERPIVCVPCAIRYEYVEDPTAALAELMTSIERHLGEPSPSDLSLVERIHRVLESLLAREERRHLGGVASGPLRDRAAALAEHLLQDVAARLGVGSEEAAPILERVARLRQKALAELGASEERGGTDAGFRLALDDLHLVTQLYSYPPGYLAESPSVERVAETLARLEEDVLGIAPARPRGRRRVIVIFGVPIPVEVRRKRGHGAAELTAALERKLQEMLDKGALEASSPRSSPSTSTAGEGCGSEPRSGGSRVGTQRLLQTSTSSRSA
jgi:1-acyl-sn-glycerol-3-phosphate acyltransferase